MTSEEYDRELRALGINPNPLGMSPEIDGVPHNFHQVGNDSILVPACTHLTDEQQRAVLRRLKARLGL